MSNASTEKEQFFDFSQLYVGCPVLISSDPSCSDETLGYVTKAKPTSCDVMAMYGGWSASLRPFADCWHVDDPRVKDRPHIFEDELRGVFKLAPQEVARVKTLERLGASEQVIEMLLSRIEKLETTTANMRKGRRSAASDQE